jgi:hypothetical protein
MANKIVLERPDLTHDAANAAMRRRMPRQRCKRPRIGTNPLPKPADTMQAGHGPRLMSRAPIEAQTLLAGELGEIDKPAAPAAPRTQEPPKIPVSLIEPDGDPID